MKKTLIALLLLPSMAMTQTQAAAPDAACWTTYNAYDAIADCQKEVLQDEKKALNTVYQKIEKAYPLPDQVPYIQHLDNAQKAWLAYRNQECVVQAAPDPDDQFKPGEDPDALSCQIKLTHQRTEFLSSKYLRKK